MTVYISLPITGHEKEAREKADRVKTMLSKLGHNPINPMTDIYAGQEASYGKYLGYDIAVLIDHCDAIFLCKGWENSPGCRIEHFVAQEMKKKVIFEERNEPSEFWR